MKVSPESVILKRLLAKYEASEHPLHPGKSNRRVMLQTKRKSDFPEYEYETASVRDSFNHAAEELSKIDFSKLDLTEITDDVTEKFKPQSTAHFAKDGELERIRENMRKKSSEALHLQENVKHMTASLKGGKK